MKCTIQAAELNETRYIGDAGLSASSHLALLDCYNWELPAMLASNGSSKTDSSFQLTTAECSQAVIHRPPPRIPTERLQKHLEQALEDAATEEAGDASQ
jgi:hypothetical protein